MSKKHGKLGGLLMLAVSGLGMVLAQSASATVFTWTGGGMGVNQLNLNNTANWGGTAPTSNTNTGMVFAGTTNTGSQASPLNQNVATPMTIASILFNSTAGVFYIGGSSFDINGGAAITQSSTSNEFISAGFSTTSTGNPGKVLTLAGTGSGTVTLSGAIVDGTRTVAVTKQDSGTYVLAGANTYTAATSITGGTLGLTGSLGNTDISVTNSGSTFWVQAGSGTVAAGSSASGSNGATLSVGSGTIVTMVDGAVETFNLQQQSSWSASTTALTLSGARSILNFPAAGRTSWR